MVGDGVNDARRSTWESPSASAPTSRSRLPTWSSCAPTLSASRPRWPSAAAPCARCGRTWAGPSGAAARLLVWPGARGPETRPPSRRAAGSLSPGLDRAPNTCPAGGRRIIDGGRRTGAPRVVHVFKSWHGGAASRLVVLLTCCQNGHEWGLGLITAAWVLCDCPARPGRPGAGGRWPGRAHGGLLQRGAGLPVGVVPATAQAGRLGLRPRKPGPLEDCLS